MWVSWSWECECGRVSAISHPSCSMGREEILSCSSPLTAYRTQESRPCTSPGYHSSADHDAWVTGEPALKSWEWKNRLCNPWMSLGTTFPCPQHPMVDEEWDFVSPSHILRTNSPTTLSTTILPRLSTEPNLPVSAYNEGQYQFCQMLQLARD